MNPKKIPRFLVFTAGYALLLQASYAAALLLRFDGEVPASGWSGYAAVAPAFTVLSLAGYFACGLYHGLWRYAGTASLFQILRGVTLSAAVLAGIGLFARAPLFPPSLVPLVWMCELVALGGARLAWLFLRRGALGAASGRSLPAIVIGAGHPAVALIQDLRRGRAGSESLSPVGILDEDPRLTGQQIEGVRVLGRFGDLARVLTEQRVEIVVISDAALPARQVREIVRACGAAGVRVKALRGLSELPPGRTALAQMREVRIEDLLGRDPVHLDPAELKEFLRGQRVMVTGAGGSIGSELARQAAAFEPAELVLLDHAENGLYYLEAELKAARPGPALHAVIADVKDADGIELAFRRHRPTVVLHAAAHKHVPLLEAHPREAVLNNVLATRLLVEAAERHGVDKFVLVSTDKAVNPTSVMGASKRVCEMLLQARARDSRTRYVAVRFGNVLGSDGSVIPLFQRQLERGGPLTVTHPEARRYFMTVPEAVRLTLQAAAMGRGGEVFLLDMGEQVRIVDLARQLIRMAGLREGQDVEIVFTGLRPGEKLYEELHSAAEQARMTRHERVLRWELDAPDEAALARGVEELCALAAAGDAEAIRRQLARLVPEYREAKGEGAPPAPASEVVELPALAGEPRDREGPPAR
ncbi:MAG TPA: nucleoside-diphosphate sugar epimerase/dehydratase [Candidatus Eisenbacteria bacterium]|jgi:FlaA1/EpsC-like NDP-sugar epimerase